MPRAGNDARHPSQDASLLFALDGRLRRLKADLGMLSVAEWLIDGRAAATERDLLFSRKIIAVSAGVREFELRQISCNQVRTIVQCDGLQCHDVSDRGIG
jgi:hypothetical protein